MDINVKQILEQLRVLSHSLEIDIRYLSHQPLGGGYLGSIKLEGLKNNLFIRIYINLDFIKADDAVSLRVTKNQLFNPDVMERIKQSISQIRHDFCIPLSNEWVSLLSEEIKIRTELYN